jgi:hypothetical protein
VIVVVLAGAEVSCAPKKSPDAIIEIYISRLCSGVETVNDSAAHPRMAQHVVASRWIEDNH